MHHKHKVREQLKKAKKSKFYGKQQTFGVLVLSPLSIVITLLKPQLLTCLYQFRGFALPSGYWLTTKKPLGTINKQILSQYRLSLEVTPSSPPTHTVFS